MAEKTYPKILAIIVLALFGLQIASTSFDGVAYSAAASPAASLNQITLTSYNGSDSSAVTAMKEGNISAYDSPLNQTETSRLGSSFNTLSAPGDLYDLLINPTNTTYGFNPFQFVQVRQALNYVVDRSLFINSTTMLDGAGVAGLSPYAGEPDELVVSNVTARYSGYNNYSISEANSTIYPVLSADGAVMTGGKWAYHGSPVAVYLFERTDDPVRTAYSKFLDTQLTDLGFNVTMVPGDFQQQASLTYSDPANTKWTIVPEGWGDIYAYYDEGLIADLTSTIVGQVPYSDSTGLTWGRYNDSQYESSSLVQLGNQADQLARTLLTGNFNTTAQRDSMIQNLTNLSFLMSTRIYLGTSLNVDAFNPSQISDLTANFVESPVLNTMSYLSMSSATGSTNIGVRYLSRGAFNPVEGFADGYTPDLSAGLVLPLEYYQPSTGYPYMIGLNYHTDSISDTANFSVPATAITYDNNTGNFVGVGPGIDAKTVVTVNFASLFANDKWADGQPITLADLLYQYAIAENVALDSKSPIYDAQAHVSYGLDLGLVAGFQIVNSTSITVYSNFFYPDHVYAAESVATEMFPLGNFLPGGGMFPWQLYQAMETIVGSGEATWSNSTSWLSLTDAADMGPINAALSSSAIPAQLMQLQSLSGVALVSPSSAQAGYSAASAFIASYGNAMISDGPYYLSSYQAPNAATLTRSPYFQAGTTFAPQLLTQATIITTQASPPPAISQGSSFTISTLSTVIGSKTSSGQSGVNVIAQFVLDGQVAYQETTTSGGGGSATISIPLSLAPGVYTLIIYASSSSSTLINPYQTSITITGSSTSSSSRSSSSSSSSLSSSSSPTPSSSSEASTSSTSTTHGAITSYTQIALAAVVVVILVVVIGIFATRRKQTAV